MLKNFKIMFNIDKKMCISIGDGANDISMFRFLQNIHLVFAVKKLYVKMLHII